MLREVFLVLYALVATTSLHAAMQVPEVNDIDDLPRYYAYLVKCLSEQPLFTGYGAKKECKILPLIEWYDSKICVILNKNLEDPLEVHDFGNGSANQRALVGGAGARYFLKSGIELWRDEEEGDRASLVEDLPDAYMEIFEDLKSGWYQSTLEKNPDIMFKQPEKNWFLFIKKQRLIDEDSLIRFLAMKFDLSTKVDSMCEWRKKPLGFEELRKKPSVYEERGMPYLWIKKDAFDEVQKIFKFYIKKPSAKDDDGDEQKSSQS